MTEADIIRVGVALAMTISYVRNRSILWALFHGFWGWFFVVYASLTYEDEDD